MYLLLLASPLLWCDNSLYMLADTRLIAVGEARSSLADKMISSTVSKHSGLEVVCCWSSKHISLPWYWYEQRPSLPLNKYSNMLVVRVVQIWYVQVITLHCRITINSHGVVINGVEGWSYC